MPDSGDVKHKVLTATGAGRRRLTAAEPQVAWAWVGWAGLVFAVVGFGDFFLAWYPAAFGSPEWEFGTVAATFSGLPLISLGLLGLVGAGLAVGRRWLIATMAVVLIGFAVLLLVAYAVFLTDIPVALRAVEGPASLGIKKAIVKTSVLAVAFVVTYLVAAVAAFRHLRKGSEG